MKGSPPGSTQLWLRTLVRLLPLAALLTASLSLATQEVIGPTLWSLKSMLITLFITGLSITLWERWEFVVPSRLMMTWPELRPVYAGIWLFFTTVILLSLSSGLSFAQIPSVAFKLCLWLGLVWLIRDLVLLHSFKRFDRRWGTRVPVLAFGVFCSVQAAVFWNLSDYAGWPIYWSYVLVASHGLVFLVIRKRPEWLASFQAAMSLLILSLASFQSFLFRVG
jgi:hypothetical protein